MIERLRRILKPFFLATLPPITLDTVLMIGKRRVYTQEQVDVMLAARREVNLNDIVSAQVTAVGFTILAAEYRAMTEFYRDRAISLPDRVSLVKAEQDASGGWSRWPLWVLMQTFGAALQMGGEPPIRTIIRLEP